MNTTPPENAVLAFILLAALAGIAIFLVEIFLAFVK